MVRVLLLRAFSFHSVKANNYIPCVRPREQMLLQQLKEILL